MKPNSQLVKFIKTARSRGYDDFQIKDPLLKKGWALEEIEKAFSAITPVYQFKNKVCIYLDSGILKILEKRAKSNLFKLSEQIEDIIRRSCVNSKKRKAQDEKLDDILVSIFSRARRK